MAVQLDFFRDTQRQATRNPRTMRVIDAGTAPDGVEIVRMGCAVCGHETEWVKSRGVKAETKGRVCPSCKGVPSSDNTSATITGPAAS